MKDRYRKVATLEKSRRPLKWRGLMISAGILIGLFTIIHLSSTFRPTTMSVRLLDQGYTVVATNTGQEPITINDAIINDRRECRGKMQSPMVLQIGQQFIHTSFGLGCNVVRIQFITDRGDETYSFSR